MPQAIRLEADREERAPAIRVALVGLQLKQWGKAIIDLEPWAECKRDFHDVKLRRRWQHRVVEVFSIIFRSIGESRGVHVWSRGGN